MLVVLGAVGLARFAFGMILPGMADDLSLDYREQGILGASYFLGYLAIVGVMPWLAPRMGAQRLCVGGLALVAAGLVAMAFGRDYAYLSVSYFAVGLGSGGAFIGAMSLPAFWFHPSHRARGAGVATAGAGVGILLSGMLVPKVSGAFGHAPWQLTWITFAALAALFCLVSAIFLRDRPGEMGLTAYGIPPSPDSAGNFAAPTISPERRWPFLGHLGLIYGLFAATGLTYTTFIVTTMVDGMSVDPATAGVLWGVVGALSIFSGAVFGNVSDRWGHRLGMFSALVVQAVAYALIALDLGMGGLYASVVLFGISAWSLPTIVAAAAGDYLGPEQAAAGFAILTLMFAVGQVVGPAGAGFLADGTGGFALSYAVATALNIVAAALCLFLRPVNRDPPVSTA